MKSLGLIYAYSNMNIPLDIQIKKIVAAPSSGRILQLRKNHCAIRIAFLRSPSLELDIQVQLWKKKKEDGEKEEEEAAFLKTWNYRVSRPVSQSVRLPSVSYTHLTLPTILLV